VRARSAVSYPLGCTLGTSAASATCRSDAFERLVARSHSAWRHELQEALTAEHAARNEDIADDGAVSEAPLPRPATPATPA